jgi:hypothetical protein
MPERRTTTRRRVLKTGTIDFGLGGVPCTVRNLSVGGATLELSSPWGMPDKFDLMISSEHLRRTCRVIWRRGQKLGVAFAGRS